MEITPIHAEIDRGSIMKITALGVGVLACSLAFAQQSPHRANVAPKQATASATAQPHGGGALVTYASLTEFLAATADLGTPAFEDFEHGFAQYLPSTQFAACIEPVSHLSNDACFKRDDLVAGISIASTNARGVIVMNPDIYSMPSRTMAAWPYRLNAQSYTAIRFDDPPTAIAADVFGFAMTDGAAPGDVVPVEIDAYAGDDSLIGTFSVLPTLYNVPAFAGFTSPVPVARVVFGTHVDYSAGPIDNLYFAGGGARLGVEAADFGAVAIDETASLQVELTNTGHLALTINSLPQPAAPYSFETDACSGTTLAPGASCTVQIRFAPTFEGDFAQDIAIPSSDPSSPTSLSLKGTGVVAVAGLHAGDGR